MLSTPASYSSPRRLTCAIRALLFLAIISVVGIQRAAPAAAATPPSFTDTL
jgi:hypothetical protein